MPNKPMDQDAKARIQSSGAAKTGGETQKDSFEARAQVIKIIFPQLSSWNAFLKAFFFYIFK